MNSDLLSAIQAVEEFDAGNLAWGLIDQSQSRLVYEECIASHLKIDELEASLLFDELIDSGAIVEIPGSKELYKSRMAEGVSLFSQLRQIFANRSVAESPSLVSDFRFVRRPRFVPVRDQNVEQLFISASGLSGDFEAEAFTREFIKESSRISKLSKFQVRAYQNLIADDGPQGIVITAGTGSGKTLAFYLPIFSKLASLIKQSDQIGTKVLAIYPRNELLKDQLREAIIALKPFNQLLERQGFRPITIGTFFGGTPTNSKYGTKDTFHCPSCNSVMSFVPNSDHVHCEQCDEGAIKFLRVTRNEMKVAPPDVLLVTSEMLSKYLSSKDWQHLFGIKAPTPVRYVLMDEIHTYAGTTGAQTGFLLRRWRALLGYFPRYVGLSATLEEPERFFSSLTGLYPSRISLVSPSDVDLEEFGGEYLLCLRGDPVSKTALLSTTIQAMMLSVRLLDSPDKNEGKGLWPPKLFAFTDDLDSMNRLFFSYLDAEGWVWRDRSKAQHRKNPSRGGYSESLAALRDPASLSVENWSEDKFRAMTEAGQNWEALKQFGHQLSALDIVADQNSSEKKGVKSEANVVIATSSLEVGFNDPLVGAVFQHKAPRSYSSFLQRKGRAGREIVARPWMVVVLSEFGRDREVFLRYEQLANPSVGITQLPMKNIHVQKMQAASATIDWLGLNTTVGDPYSLLKNMSNGSQLEELKKRLLSVLNEESWRDKLVKFLARSLGVDDDSLEEILWTSPRALIPEFIPSLVRDIETRGGGLNPVPRANRVSPAPEHITATLFASLNVPDVVIEAPEGGSQAESRTMSFFQALRDFAPGRISKRFQKEWADIWWVVPENFSLQEKDISGPVSLMLGPSATEYCTAYQDETQVEIDGQSILVVRPLNLKPRIAKPSEHNITDRSNSIMNWHVDFRPGEQSIAIPLVAKTSGVGMCVDMFGFMHTSGNPVEIVRYSTGARASFTTRQRDTLTLDFTFKHEVSGADLAVGTTLFCDAVKFDVSFADKALETLKTSSAFWKLRGAIFERVLLAKHSEFAGLSEFDVGWLKDCFLAYLLSQVSNRDCSISDVCAELSASIPQELLDVPAQLFERDNRIDDEQGELQLSLEAHLSNPSTVKSLVETMAITFDPTHEAFLDAFWSLLRDTCAGALKSMVSSLVRDADEQSLQVDLEYSKPNEFSVWVSETDPGGCGYIQQFLDTCVRDPRFIADIFKSVCAESDQEVVVRDLYAVLNQASENPSFLDNYRSAESSVEQKNALQNIFKVVTESGANVSHTFRNVLNLKLLRQGSDQSTDEQLLNLIERWFKVNREHGFEWPLTQFAFAESERLQRSGSHVSKNRVQDMLYPMGWEVRKNVLDYYQVFSGKHSTDRIILSEMLMGSDNLIQVERSDWESFDSALRERGEVAVVIPFEAYCSITEVLSHASIRPIDYQDLLFYPRLVRVSRTEEYYLLIFDLLEAQIS